MEGGEMEHGDDEKEVGYLGISTVYTFWVFGAVADKRISASASVMLQELLSLTYLCLLEIKIWQSTICK